MSKRVVLTAGFNRSLHVLTVAELLRRDGVNVAGVIIVSPYGVERLRGLIRQRGTAVLRSAVPRLLGRRKAARSGSRSDAMADLMSANNITPEPLSKWAERNSVPITTVASINDPSAISFVRTVSPDWVLYGGGGIIHEGFIDAARGRILNAHSGPLPHIRGMNACEWSILLGHAPTITIHVINRGIDTGGTISEHPVPVLPGDTIESLRQRCVAVGVTAMRKAVNDAPDEIPVPSYGASRYRQCYVLAPAIREILEQRLAMSASN